MKLLTLLPALLLSSQVLADVPAPPTQLCFDEQCASTPELPKGDMKWHPGHYMLLQTGNSQSQRFSYYDADLAGNASLAGAQVRWSWAELEPSQGNYNFSAIEADLARLQSMGKRLWIQVLDRKFNTTDSSGIIPSYMMTSAYNGGLVQNRSGYVARLWESKVMDRKIALMQALAARFDNEPFVEGITGAETAMGFDAPLPDGYSAAILAAQLKREVSAMTAAFRHTNVFVYTNFIGSEAVMIDLIGHIHRNRAAAGGPDTLPPPRDGTLGQLVFVGTIGGTDYRGLMPIGQTVQSPELGGKEGNWTPQELWAEGIEDLGATHMSWVRKTGTPGTTWAEIKAYLRSNSRINVQCPENYGNSCDTT
jgi:hypothetical protein